METPVRSILLFVVASLFGALGQFLYKSGADRASGSIASYVLNLPLITGVICYVAVMVLFIAGFKQGGAMSVLYPVYATTFIFGAVIALVAFHEPIRPVNIVGMGTLILGMYLMGIGK